MYVTLLDLGPSTGYAVAHASGFARANAYAALEGLVRRGVANRAAGKPARYRATDPQSVLVQLAAEQGERLEQLSRAFAATRRPVEPVTCTFEGLRAVANVIQRLVARAEHSVEGVLGADLWQPTLPAWRRASARAKLQVRIAGIVGDTGGLDLPAAPPDHPTLLLVDGAHVITAAVTDGTLSGLWSSHALIVGLSRMAFRSA